MEAASVIVKIRVGNVRSQILYDPSTYGSYFQSCMDAIDKQTAVVVKDHEMTPAFQKGYWDGLIHLFNSYTMTRNNLGAFEFYTGKLREVLEILHRFGYVVEFIDERHRPKTGRIKYEWNENFPPYDFQEKVINDAVERNRGIIKLATGAGKCCSANSLILTSQGMVEIGDLGRDLNPQEDRLLKIDLSTPLTGSKTDVSSHIYRDGESLSWDVYTSCNFNICGTPAHRIKVVSDSGDIVWRRLDEVRVGDYAVITKGQQMFGQSDTVSLESSYLCGTLIEGSSDSDKEFRLKDLGFDLDTSSLKSIPKSILTSKKEVVSAFVRGLFEANGRVKEKGTHMLEVDLSSKRLADQLQVVLLNFGVVAIRKKGSGDSHTLSVHPDFLPRFIEEIDPIKLNLTEVIENITGSGSELDVVPNQSSHFKHLRDLLESYFKTDIFSLLKKSVVKKETYESWMSGTESPNKKVLISFLEWLDPLCATNDIRVVRDHFDSLCSDEFYFDKVETKNQTMSDNYDFVVPASHSFISQGFINHNTNVAAGIFNKLGTSPCLFFVTSKDLMEQAYNRFRSLLKTDNIGRIGDGHCDIHDINVCTIQTCVMAFGKEEEYLAQQKKMSSFLDGGKKSKEKKVNAERYADIRNLVSNAETVIFDECHHAASDTCRMILELCDKALFRYGLGATVERDDGLDKVIEALFGDYICNISLSYLIKRGFLIPPTIFMIPQKDNLGMCENYQTEYKTYVTENATRNQKVAQCAAAAIEGGLQTLVLVRYIPHGEKLEKMINDIAGEGSAVLLHGTLSSSKRRELIERMKTKDLKCLISTSLSHSEKILVKNDEDGIIECVSIGDFTNKFQKDVGSKSISGYSVLSLNRFDKDPEFKKVTHVHKKKKIVPILEVKSKSNLLCEVTDNHSLITSKNKRDLIEFFPAQESGNIIIPKDLSHLNDLEVKSINLCDFIYEQGKANKYSLFSSYLTHSVVDKLKVWYKILRNYEVENSVKMSYRDSLVKSGLCDKEFNLSFKGQLFIKNYKKIMNFKYKNLSGSGKRHYYTFEDVYGNDFLTEFLDLKICAKRSKTYCDYRMELSEDLFGFLGFYCAKGYISKTNDSKRSQKRVALAYCSKVEKSILKLGLKYNLNKEFVYLNDSTFSSLMMDVFNLGVGSSDKRLPKYIFNVKTSVRESFLFGLYMGSGFLNEGSFGLNTYSPHMARDISFFLRTLGYTNIVCQADSSASSEDKRVKYVICTHHGYRVDMNESLLIKDDSDIAQREVEYYNCDALPNGEELVTSTTVIKENDKFVYDVSVEENENFFCGVGPILAHNTLADEGLDIQCLQCLVLAGSGKSFVKTIQRIGRVIRLDPDNPDKVAIVYDFMDLASKILKKHSLRRMAIYLEEEMFKVVDMRKQAIQSRKVL